MAKIQNNQDLDQYHPWGKQPLKLMKEARDEQYKKAHPKSIKPQAKPKAKKLESSEKPSKKVEKAKKEKKKNRREQ